MILFNSDVSKNIALFNYLNKKYSNEVLLKNNILYSINEIKLDINGKFLNDNLKDYIYYYVNDSKCELVKHIENYEYKLMNTINLDDLDEFKKIDNGFFSKGNVIILYFSSPYIQNPLDILSTIASSINVIGIYNDIKLDYIIYKNKIVYYVLFRYSSYLEKNLNEINKISDKITNLENVKPNMVKFPDVQTQFQNEILKGFSKIQSMRELTFEGQSIFSPFYKLIF